MSKTKDRKGRGKSKYSEIDEEEDEFITHYREIDPIKIDFEIKTLKEEGSDEYWFGELMYYPFVHQGEIWVDISVVGHKELYFYKRLIEVVTDDERFNVVFNYIHQHLNDLSVYYYSSLSEAMEKCKIAPIVKLNVGALVSYDNPNGNTLCEVIGHNDLDKTYLPYIAHRFQVNIIVECDSDPLNEAHQQIKEETGSTRNCELTLLISAEERQVLGDAHSKQKALAIIYKNKYDLQSKKFKNQNNLNKRICAGKMTIISNKWDKVMDLRFVGLEKSVYIAMELNEFRYSMKRWLRIIHGITGWKTYKDRECAELTTADVISIFGSNILKKEATRFKTICVDLPMFTYRKEKGLILSGHIKSKHNATGAIKGDYKTKKKAKLAKMKKRRENKKAEREKNKKNDKTNDDDSNDK